MDAAIDRIMQTYDLLANRTAAASEEHPQWNKLFSALTERFAQLGGVDLDLPARTTPPRATDPARMDGGRHLLGPG